MRTTRRRDIDRLLNASGVGGWRYAAPLRASYSGAILARPQTMGSVVGGFGPFFDDVDFVVFPVIFLVRTPMLPVLRGSELQRRLHLVCVLLAVQGLRGNHKRTNATGGFTYSAA